MRFAFTDDQIAFRDAVRELLEKECTPAHLRAAWTNATGRIPGLWDKLVEMGVVGMLVPEASGGLGLTMVDLVLILEETGRCALPEPIVESAAFGVPFLGRADIAVGVATLARAVGRHRRRDRHRRRAVRTRRGRAGRAPVGRRCPPPVRSARHAHSDRRAAVVGFVHTRRHRHRRAAMRARAAHARPDRGVHEGTAAVRRADRLVPGREAPPRQRAHRARVRAPARLPGRGHRSTPCTRAWRRARPTRPRYSPPRRRCSATAPSATRPSTTCTST